MDATTPGAFEKVSFSSELGVSGLKVWSGFVDEEFLRQLKGTQGQRVFREMSETATVGAVLSAFELILRAVEWRTEPADESAAAKDEADFVDSLFDDMSHSWEDFLSEVLSMLVYGWAYHEIVLKRRIGPLEASPERRSKYTDGRIGIRKLPIRSQDTLERWEMQKDGGIAGMWQRPWITADLIMIPIEKSLLFRTTSRKNNPEGVSVLRSAYEAWYALKHIQFVEQVGIERDLCGVPVIYAPGRLSSTSAAPEEQALYAALQKIVRDLKFNEQAGLVIAGDPYFDTDGNPTQMRQIELKLLQGAGARTIDTVAVKNDYKRDITRAVLADFLMLGQDKGAYNLAESKVDLFLKSCESVNGQIASVLNRFLIPRIWDANGLDHELMPKRLPGRVAPADLTKLATFIRDLATAGATIFPDDELENFLRAEADLPEKSEEAIAQQEAEARALAEAAAAAATPPPREDDDEDASPGPGAQRDDVGP